MNFVYLKDRVHIDAKGWVKMTNRNMELLGMNVGDLYHFGIDLEEHPIRLERLFFSKAKNVTDSFDRSKVIEIRNYKSVGSGFYFNPVLNQLNITPPLFCTLDLSNDLDKYHFSWCNGHL